MSYSDFIESYLSEFPYAIFYRLNREAEVVQVYRVLALRRDPPKVFER